MAENDDIRLLGTSASPYVNRVQFVCNLKSIDYEFVEENLACKSELLLISNPIHKKVPVLLHANKPPICESLVIIEYLDEIKPDVHRILPSFPIERANNRFWSHYIDKKVCQRSWTFPRKRFSLSYLDKKEFCFAKYLYFFPYRNLLPFYKYNSCFNNLWKMMFIRAYPITSLK